MFRLTVLAKLLYASPAWSEFCSAADVNKLNNFLNKCKNYITANISILTSPNCLNLLTNFFSLQSNPLLYIYSTPSFQQNHPNHTTFDPAVTISYSVIEHPPLISAISYHACSFTMPINAVFIAILDFCIILCIVRFNKLLLINEYMYVFRLRT